MSYGAPTVVSSTPQAVTGSAVFKKPRKKKSNPSVTVPGTRPPRTPTPGAQQPAPPWDGAPTSVTSPYTPDQININAAKTSHAQFMPQYGQINAERYRQGLMDKQRTADIASMQTWQGNNLKSAFDDTTNALNKLVALSNGGNADAQKMLASALTQDQASAALGGGPANTDERQMLLAAALQQGGADQTNLANSAAADTTALGSARANAGIAANQETANERGRYNAALADLNNQEAGVAASEGTQTGANIVQGQKDERDYALAVQKFGEDHASRLFQQYLAEKEFNLKDKSETFQEWLSTQQLGQGQQQIDLAATKQTHDMAVDWANVGIAKENADSQVESLRQQAASTKDKTKADKLTARANTYQKGYELLSSIMAPGKGEGSAPLGAQDPAGTNNPPGSTGTPDNIDTPNVDESKGYGYRRQYNNVVSQMFAGGIPKDIIYRILMHSEYPDWSAKATNDFNSLKQKGGVGYHPKKPRKAPQHS